MAGYPYQRYPPSPNIDAYTAQQINFQSQQMQTQIHGQFNAPYLMQQMTMPPAQQPVRAMQHQHPYNMHGMNPQIEQQMATMKQTQGIKHGQIQGAQALFQCVNASVPTYSFSSFCVLSYRCDFSCCRFQVNKGSSYLVWEL